MEKSESLFLTELFKIKRFGKTPNLLVMQEILEKINNPHKNLKFIHIAGTNGKGSVSNYISEILIQAGYRVGLFTSPFIHKFNERIKINNVEICDKDLEETGMKILNLTKTLPYEVKQFDIITLIAMEWFSKNKCDYVVLEAGMGGRNDSTNIVIPLISVITTIDLDHTQVLGKTVEEIAYEKAGIIKENTPLYYYPTDKDDILLKECKLKNAPYFTLDNPEIIESSALGTCFKYKSEEYKIKMLGKYQVYNACLAIDVCSKLADLDAIKKGVYNMKLEGRFEKISESPTVFLDGGHNPQGAQNLIETIEFLKIKNPVFIVSMYKEKDADNYIVKLLSKGEIIFSSFDDDMCYNPCDLALKYGQRAMKLNDAVDMIKSSTEDKTYIFCGSLYQISKIKSFFDKTR